MQGRMKVFASGAVVGALVCFAAIRIIDTDPEPARSAAIGQPSCPDTLPLSSPPPAQTAASSIEPAPAAAGSAAGKRSDWTPPSLPSPGEEKRLSIENLSEDEANAICMHAHKLRQQREQAKKDAEPKDEGWAYPMEQLITQHIASYLPKEKYTKLRVECRTTFCEMRIEGKNMEDRELADKLAQEIAQQRWSDIAPKGSGSGYDGETWNVHYEWYRPRTENERKLFFRNRDQP